MQKSIFKYALKDSVKSSLIFIGIIIVIFIFMTLVVSVNVNGEIISINGAGFAAMIFVFVASVSTLASDMRYMNQSGFSRKTSYANFIGVFLVIALALAIVIQLIVFLFKMFAVDGVEILSDFSMLFGSDMNGELPLSIAWLFFAIVATSSLGFFIAMLYQKMEIKVKIFVSVGVPVFFLMIVPILDYAFFNNAITNAISTAINFILGVYNGAVSPLLSIGMLALVSIVLFEITYVFLVRRLNYK